MVLVNVANVEKNLKKNFIKKYINIKFFFIYYRMDLLSSVEKIKKRPTYQSPIANVNRVFEYYERTGKNEDGTTPVIIKLEPEEQKKKKSIN